MGGGSWNVSSYTTRSASKVSEHGTAFVYDKTAKAAGKWEVHEDLDPKRVAGAASPFAGTVMRESRDSDEHPESLPICVFFDVTGSMSTLPVNIQRALPKLYGLLLARGYVEHPQVLFGAIGDAYSDRVPLQVGQFESDNRADESLENLFLEGGGGGGNHESYELAAYMVARHTTTDSWEKRGKRGYCFFIGDERVYAIVRRDHVRRLAGGSLQEDLPTADLFRELTQKWDTYYLFAEQSPNYRPDMVVPAAVSDGQAHGWAELLGQNAMILSDVDAVCETIAGIIGIGEGAVDLSIHLENLAAAGSGAKEIEAAERALVAVGAGAVAERGDADGDLDLGDEGGAERL